MNGVAIGILQATAVIVGTMVGLWLLFQAWLRIMYHTKWKHD